MLQRKAPDPSEAKYLTDSLKMNEALFKKRQSDTDIVVTEITTGCNVVVERL